MGEDGPPEFSFHIIVTVAEELHQTFIIWSVIFIDLLQTFTISLNCFLNSANRLPFPL